MQIDETRGEILRLVARLRASRLSAGKGASAASRAEGETQADGPKPTRRPSRRERARAPAPGAAPDTGSDRLHQRRKELAEIRQLRKRLEERSAQGRSFTAALERVEQRITGLEEAIARLRRSSYPPARRRSSNPPSRRSRSPPSQRGSKHPAALAPVSQEDRSDWTLSGRIQEQMLSDMLQLVSSNGMTGIFVVENEDARTELYFEEGGICHAAGAGMVGEQAFFAAFGADYGQYYFREMEELPEERTIDSSTQLLILEALRQIDESNK